MCQLLAPRQMHRTARVSSGVEQSAEFKRCLTIPWSIMAGSRARGRSSVLTKGGWIAQAPLRHAPDRRILAHAVHMHEVACGHMCAARRMHRRNFDRIEMPSEILEVLASYWETPAVVDSKGYN